MSTEDTERSVTVCVLLVDQDKIFLVKNLKDSKTIPGKEPFIKPEGWGMLRGRRELQDEDDVATGQREAEEESGYSVIEVDSRYSVSESRADHNIVAFIGYPVSGTPKPDTKEIIEARWFSPRVLWAEFGRVKDNIDMHPRQRRMAQKLWQKFKGGS